MSQLYFLSMGSGSSGNCYYIGTSDFGILIDAGVAVSTIKSTLKENGIPLSNIWGILVTHAHTDHTKSVGILNVKYHIPIFATKKTYDGILRNQNITQKPDNCYFINKSETFLINEFSILPFHVSHDSSDCSGYTIRYGNKQFTIATDLGEIGPEATEQIKEAHYLVIESNYDENMLLNGPYPQRLKQRVQSSSGHLCNSTTARFLADNWNPRFEHIFLCHLSGENNTPDLALQTTMNTLRDANITPCPIEPLQRCKPSALYKFNCQ